jgi:hypothetical protein
MKKLKVAVISLIIFGLCGGGLYLYTIHEGRKALIALAKEYNFCESEECSEGLVKATEAVIKATNRYSSQNQIEWCLGTETIANTRVQKGGFLKIILVDAMNMRCPNPL